MRILHIITKLHEMYGAQRHAVECMKNHLINGHQTKIIAGTDGIVTNDIKALGIEVIVINTIKNSYNPFVDIKAIVAIIKEIKAYQPDLVISHSTKAGILSRIACYKTKTANIFTVQGWPFEIGTPIHQRIIGLLIEKCLLLFSDSYMCVSRFTEQYGKKHLPIKEKQLYVCANMHEQKRVPIKGELKVYNNVLMVAGFREQKDHITALKAFKTVLQILPNLSLTFAGEGPKRKEIESFIASNGLQNNVILLGDVKNIDDHYKACDILILTTFYEGLPLSLLEGLQNGKPLIATNVGGNNETIKENINGNLIAVQDDKALANHIVDYYTNNRLNELSTESTKLYNELFVYEKVSAKLNFIINEAVRNSRFKKIVS